MARHIPDRHRRAARMLGFTLTIADERPDAWQGAAFVWSARLTQAERAGLAYAALCALPPEARELTFAAAHWGEVGEGAGVPCPVGDFVMDDARWWAGLANPRERKAYALACFEAMPPADRAAFLRHVRGRAAA